MDRTYNDDWTANVKGFMHKYRITNGMLSEKSGYSTAYLSEVLNSKRTVHRYTKCAICNALYCIANEKNGTLSIRETEEMLANDETTDTC